MARVPSAAALTRRIKACTECAKHLPYKPNPVFAFARGSRILLAGQAPGLRVQESGIPWNDPSGARLREWLGVTEGEFYDPKRFAIVPMGFCYPGKGKSGDLPPRPECAPLWMDQVLAAIGEPRLRILIGRYAQEHFLGDRARETTTETVRAWKGYGPKTFVLPHPSPRNNIWLKKNPWFGKEVLPKLSRAVRRALAVWVLCGLGAAASAQPGPPRARKHSVSQSSGQLDLVPAEIEPAVSNRVSIEIEGEWRVIRSNGIPGHQTGDFPNHGNPHKIEAQSHVFRVPAEPKIAFEPTEVGLGMFGVALNGVPFDPGAAEWYGGEHDGAWRYEALSGAVGLGLDQALAHAQPGGAYHYHGIAELLLEELGFEEGKHSPIVGWAADGYPIYARFGYVGEKNGKHWVREPRSGYRLKKGKREGGYRGPGGTYDGTFVSDYEYVKRGAELDECNGRHGITPDFPEGTYAYFLTKEFPVIPRCFRGTPSEDFLRGPRRMYRHRPPRPGRRPRRFRRRR